jgi:hypothetical protein
VGGVLNLCPAASNSKTDDAAIAKRPIGEMSFISLLLREETGLISISTKMLSLIDDFVTPGK